LGRIPYLARPGSAGAYLEAYRHGAVKLARGGEPAIPEVLVPRFRADAGGIGGRLLRWSNDRLPSIQPKAKPCAEGRSPKAFLSADELAASATLPSPGRRGQAAERRSDMVRHGEFENFPSFRAVR